MSHTRSLPLLLALALALGPAGPGVRAQASLPALGEAASADFSIADERLLGEQIMRDIRRDPEYLDDPVLLEYLQSIWMPLVDESRKLGNIGADIGRSFAWEVFLVRDRSVNAFALPGGHVGVHLGLIAMTASRDELASVLAHELSHVTQRHIARGIGTSQRTGTLGLAAMILGVLVASRAGNADAAQAAIVGGQAAMIQGQLNFSRDMEREADRIGYSVLDGAGYSPRGMAAMFEKLEFANRLNDSNGFPYLRSHPLTTERISEARSRVPERMPAVSATPLHALMQARARVLMDGSSAALRRLQDASGSPGPENGGAGLAVLYAQAMASAQLKDRPAAHRAIDATRARIASGGFDAGTRRAVQRLAAEVFLTFGEAAQAEQVLADDGADTGRPGLLLRTQLALTRTPAGAAADAPALRRSTEALQVWTSENPNDAAAWTALAQVAEAAGLPLRAQRAYAEALAATGDVPAAIERLRIAQRAGARSTGDDLIELQIVDARLRTLQRQLHEWREAARTGR